MKPKQKLLYDDRFDKHLTQIYGTLLDEKSRQSNKRNRDGRCGPASIPHTDLVLEVDEGRCVFDAVLLGRHLVRDLDDVDPLTVQFIIDGLQFFQDGSIIGFIAVVCREEEVDITGL